MAHQRLKRGGRAHHQHPSRAARRLAGREGNRRGAASLRLVATDAGNPCCPASDAAFRVCPGPQRRGLRPLRERRCGCSQSGPPLRRHERDPRRRKWIGTRGCGPCRAGRAKTNRRHRVPLCGGALEILEVARHSGREPVHWSSPMGAGVLSMTASCAACCASRG